MYGMSYASMLVLTIVAFVGVSSTSIYCSAFSHSQARESASLVPRITLDEYKSSSHEYNRIPVIIRDIISPQVVESLADELMDTLGNEVVQMQRKIKDYENDDDASDPQTTTEIYDIKLLDAVEYMMDSQHDDSYFAFCEGLLPGSTPTSTKLSDKLRDIREAPFCNEENWFDYFPNKIKPTDAIILAGEGATSTLHRDPFEWTGTSLCLEGTKIWRFILPPEQSNGGVALVDELLQSYRLNSIAWEEEHDDELVVLSAGWQSDMSLYDTVDDNFPSAFEWVTIEEEDNDNFIREMEYAGSTLQPSTAALDALDRISRACGSNESRSVCPYMTAIQQPGDLLLIPAHCWHQTYAPVPSVAVASQRCGVFDGSHVIKHILDVSKYSNKNMENSIPDLLRCNNYEEGMGEEVVAKLFETIKISTN